MCRDIHQCYTIEGSTWKKKKTKYDTATLKVIESDMSLDKNCTMWCQKSYKNCRIDVDILQKTKIDVKVLYNIIIILKKCKMFIKSDVTK